MRKEIARTAVPANIVNASMYEIPSAPRVARSGICPVCDCTASVPAFTSPDFLHGVPGEYTYVSCQQCHTVYQDPKIVVADLSLCYPDAYFTHSVPTQTSSAPSLSSGWRHQLRKSILIHADGAQGICESPVIRVAGRLLAAIGPMRRRARFGLMDALGRKQGESRCLDLGAGNGMTLRCLSRLGWEATGVEIDQVAAEQARRFSGCDVRAGALSDAGFRSGVFHMIHVSHVIEHLPDLKQTLELCFDLLAPGGRLVLIYPNPNSLLARRIHKFAVTWDPPRHLVIPPSDSLVSLLRRIRFDRVRSETSARFAVPYRAVSRRYVRGIAARGFEAKAQMSDHLFKLFETLCVMAGFAVGEEVMIVAHKR